MVRYVDSAGRVLPPPSVPGLPALSARGGSWRFVALDLDFDGLRAAAKSGGGSVNDAYLAALLAAFRLYHAELGAPLEGDAKMPVSVPVSVRRDGDSAGGNRFAPARLVAPVGIVDPIARMERVGQLVRAARSEPALESADLVAPLMARLPGSLLVRVAGTATAGNDLQASNVVGVEEDLYLAGALIERIYPFAPLPGCAADDHVAHVSRRVFCRSQPGRGCHRRPRALRAVPQRRVRRSVSVAPAAEKPGLLA